MRELPFEPSRPIRPSGKSGILRVSSRSTEKKTYLRIGQDGTLLPIETAIGRKRKATSSPVGSTEPPSKKPRVSGGPTHLLEWSNPLPAGTKVRDFALEHEVREKFPRQQVEEGIAPTKTAALREWHSRPDGAKTVPITSKDELPPAGFNSAAVNKFMKDQKTADRNGYVPRPGSESYLDEMHERAKAMLKNDAALGIAHSPEYQQWFLGRVGELAGKKAREVVRSHELAPQSPRALKVEIPGAGSEAPPSEFMFASPTEFEAGFMASPTEMTAEPGALPA